MTDSKRFAEGRKAKAQCPICGDVILYPGLVRDWRGVYVCPDCNDPRNPQEHIHVYADPTALEHPRPLLDTESRDANVRPGVVRGTFSLGKVTAVGS
jgi:hypothetical protein